MGPYLNKHDVAHLPRRLRYPQAALVCDLDVVVRVVGKTRGAL